MKSKISRKRVPTTPFGRWLRSCLSGEQFVMRGYTQRNVVTAAIRVGVKVSTESCFIIRHAAESDPSVEVAIIATCIDSSLRDNHITESENENRT